VSGASGDGTAPQDGASRDGCPLCQLLGLLHQARPEVAEHLGAAVAELGAALRELLREQGGSPPGGGHDRPVHPGGAGERPRTGRSGRVEKISISD